MTDNKIIKALECCKKNDCDNCPNGFGNCYANLAGYALDLINRQRVEIEKLANKCDDCAGCTQWECDCSLIKDELVKEFANRLKAMLTPYPEVPFCEMVGSLDIDALVKEITEGES